MGDKLNKPKSKVGSRSDARASAVGTGQKKRQDAILIHGVSEDGESMAVLRAREDRLEAGVLRTVKPGRPIDGELLKLTPRADFPLVCDVEVELPAGAINAAGGTELNATDRREGEGARRESRGRPAQVATENYRENWDAIWRKPGKKALAN
jgi:hypothetical protein